MVRISPDSERLKGLESLRKRIEAKEKEYKEEEDKKRKELEELGNKRKKDLEKIEKKLEEAVEILTDSREEEESSDDDVEFPEVHGPDLELEQTILEESQQRMLEEVARHGPAYDIERGDLEMIPALYGSLREELASGNPATEVVKQAREIMYALDKSGVYMSSEARGLFTRDVKEDNYIKRLGALLDILDEKTDRSQSGMYQ